MILWRLIVYPLICFVMLLCVPAVMITLLGGLIFCWLVSLTYGAIVRYAGKDRT